MVPSLLPPPVTPPAVNGHALDDLSDSIDTVNILKSKMKSTSSNKTEFRQYEDACDRVKAFYSEQHEKQTVAYNLKARNQMKSTVRAEMGIWQAMEKLNSLIDDSDPDTSLSQIEHLLQSAEALRRDGKPRWMQVTGLIHDLGKLMFFYGAQGQWDVVGDTFPVGCAFDKKNIYPGSFTANEDFYHPVYSTDNGIYEPGCGMDNVMISWGHDEYLYHVVKDQSMLPKEALAIIRYHSFYPWHKEGAYHRFMNKHDEEMLKAVREFNPYDLYSKSDDIPDVEQLKVSGLDLFDTVSCKEHVNKSGSHTILS